MSIITAIDLKQARRKRNRHAARALLFSAIAVLSAYYGASVMAFLCGLAAAGSGGWAFTRTIQAFELEADEIREGLED